MKKHSVKQVLVTTKKSNKYISMLNPDVCVDEQNAINILLKMLLRIFK